MLSIRYFQKRIRQICESKICSSILNAKIPLLCFFFSGSWMPGGMECVTQLLLALLLYHLVTDTLWLFLVNDFHMETEGYSPVRGNHSIPPPGSLCNEASPRFTKGKFLGGPSCWMWKLPVEASLSQLSFPVQRTWGMETAAGGRRVPFPSNMVCFLTVRLLHLHWRLAQPAWAVSAGCMDMSPNKYTRALRMKIQERSLGQASKMVKHVSVQFRAGLGACSESQEASQSTNQVLGPPGQDTVGY